MEGKGSGVGGTDVVGVLGRRGKVEDEDWKLGFWNCIELEH